jgi:hypothetical protein
MSASASAATQQNAKRKPSSMRRPAALLLLGAAFLCLANGCLMREEEKPKGSVTGNKQEEVKLSGAELYAINCNRCHPERYAPERTAEQWSTILLHMRTRANLPAEQARVILHFLQEDSGK